jgi:hypothetical protein
VGGWWLKPLLVPAAKTSWIKSAKGGAKMQAVGGRQYFTVKNINNQYRILGEIIDL